MPVVPPGLPAPDFTLARHEGEPFTRADLEGYRALIRELGLRR